MAIFHSYISLPEGKAYSPMCFLLIILSYLFSGWDELVESGKSNPLCGAFHRKHTKETKLILQQ